MGENAHAEGSYTVVTGYSSHAEGTATQASGYISHAEGSDTVASGDFSHTGGLGSQSIGKHSFAHGHATNALGDSTVAMGKDTIAGIKGYHWIEIAYPSEYMQNPQIVLYDKTTGAMPTSVSYEVGDVISVVNGSKYPNCATIIAKSSNIITVDSLPFSESVYGDDIDDNSLYVIAKPLNGIVNLGPYAHAEGDRSKALEMSSHAEGRETLAYGQYSHAEGRGSEAGYCAHAEGYKTKAEGFYSHVEGFEAKSVGSGSHGEGKWCSAEGEATHAEGYNTIADGKGSHSEGMNTKASSDGAHAEGIDTKAIGYASHAGGCGTIAGASYQTVIGRYNVDDREKPFIIGYGYSDNRRNIHTVDTEGNAEYLGGMKLGGTITVEGDKKLAKQSKTIETWLYKDNWSGSVYDFEELKNGRYLRDEYDLLVFFNGGATDVTYAMKKAYDEAELTSSNANLIKCMGTVPTIDIPILLRVEEK